MRYGIQITILVIFLAAGLRIFTDVTTTRWTGSSAMMCANVTDAHTASQENFQIACGDTLLTMRSQGTWSPEFRRLTTLALSKLYQDRPFRCLYAFEIIDTWYALPLLNESYRDCHQVKKKRKYAQKRFA